MKGYFGHIEKDTLENDYFRKVLFTAPHCQLVLMTLKPGEEIGAEVHEDNDQFFRFEAGTGKVVVGEDNFEVKDGDTVIIPSGSEHNVINTSTTESLKMYTIYAPAHHPDGTIHKTKAEAEAAEANEHDHH